MDIGTVQKLLDRFILQVPTAVARMDRSQPDTRVATDQLVAEVEVALVDAVAASVLLLARLYQLAEARAENAAPRPPAPPNSRPQPRI